MKSNKRKNQGSDVSEDNSKFKRVTRSQSLKLQDLNEDVLMKIFSYLTVEDLVNVVNSDKRFLDCSRRTVQRKYKTEYIHLPLKYKDQCYISKQCVRRNADILRYFGANISRLEIDFNDRCANDRRILDLIIKSCRDNLTELRVLRPNGELKINESFNKVKNLTISIGYIIQSLDQLVEWFPMLENLVFNYVDGVGPNSRNQWIRHRFRNLSLQEC